MTSVPDLEKFLLPQEAKVSAMWFRGLGELSYFTQKKKKTGLGNVAMIHLKEERAIEAMQKLCKQQNIFMCAWMFVCCLRVSNLCIIVHSDSLLHFTVNGSVLIVIYWLRKSYCLLCRLADGKHFTACVVKTTCFSAATDLSKPWDRFWWASATFYLQWGTYLDVCFQLQRETSYICDLVYSLAAVNTIQFWGSCFVFFLLVLVWNEI